MFPGPESFNNLAVSRRSIIIANEDGKVSRLRPVDNNLSTYILNGRRGTMPDYGRGREIMELTCTILRDLDLVK